MTNHQTNQHKVERPAAHFDHAHEVVADPTLSKEQKEAALEHLEQDARQLAIASAEGMTGGEATELHEVLAAKDLLELPPTAYAYEIVLQDLHARADREKPGDLRAAIEKTMATLRSLEPVLKKAS